MGKREKEGERGRKEGEKRKKGEKGREKERAYGGNMNERRRHETKHANTQNNTH